MNSGNNLAMVIILGTLLMVFLAAFIIYFIVFYRKKQAENQQEKKQMELKYNQALLESQMEIQEQLLQQVSSELHDNLGQVAALIKINLVTFPTDISAQAQDKLDQSKELMKKLMADIKTLSINLNTDYLESEGLLSVLEREAEKINRTGHIRATFTKVGYLPTMEKGKEIFLYRMVQELTGNILKHAQASELFITADANEKELVIQVKDNGVGFDPVMVEKTATNTSTGLRSLRKRCQLIGANFHIESTPGNGTFIQIQLPLQT